MFDAATKLAADGFLGEYKELSPGLYQLPRPQRPEPQVVLVDPWHSEGGGFSVAIDKLAPGINTLPSRTLAPEFAPEVTSIERVTMAYSAARQLAEQVAATNEKLAARPAPQPMGKPVAGYVEEKQAPPPAPTVPTVAVHFDLSVEGGEQQDPLEMEYHQVVNVGNGLCLVHDRQAAGGRKVAWFPTISSRPIGLALPAYKKLFLVVVEYRMTIGGIDQCVLRILRESGVEDYQRSSTGQQDAAESMLQASVEERRRAIARQAEQADQAANLPPLPEAPAERVSRGVLG